MQRGDKSASDNNGEESSTTCKPIVGEQVFSRRVVSGSGHFLQSIICVAVDHLGGMIKWL